MRQFLLILLATTALLALVGYVAFSQLWPQHYNPHLLWALLLVAGVTFASHHFLLKAFMQKKQRDFNNLFLSVTTGKLMFYLFGIVIYVVLQSAHAKSFLIGFLVLYFAFTTIEIATLMVQIKRFRAKAN